MIRDSFVRLRKGIGENINLATTRKALSVTQEEEEEEEEAQVLLTPTQKQRSKEKKKKNKSSSPIKSSSPGSSKKVHVPDSIQVGKMANHDKKQSKAPEEVPSKRKLVLGYSNALKKAKVNFSRHYPCSLKLLIL